MLERYDRLKEIKAHCRIQQRDFETMSTASQAIQLACARSLQH